VLQLINAIDPVTGQVGPFSLEDQSLTESLASQAAIALSNRLLITQLETLFESFVKLINVAIDEKSPYTGGHCERVPQLTMMLAEAADATTTGPLADFRMSERDRYELQMAGLLHDCGKITTPVHVVDKATKLQTIYDRIGLIDTRFEVLKRDAELDALRAQLALRPAVDAGAEAVALAALQSREVQALDEDREFLRRCNHGSEAMQAGRPATRARHRHAAPVAQPRRCADQLFERRGDGEPHHPLRHADAGRARHHQLPHRRHHQDAGATALAQHLKTNVPEYAGGHHERMDGKGYPRGLTRDQMSVQARMMGIADIFEALTAADRPYKSGMKLSQALGIMERMVHNGHIDPDLFEVFRAGARVSALRRAVSRCRADGRGGRGGLRHGSASAFAIENIAASACWYKRLKAVFAIKVCAPAPGCAGPSCTCACALRAATRGPPARSRA
jgi:hypothetical protein